MANLKILYVDDDTVDQMAFRRMAKKNLAYDIEIAASVSQAKEKINGSQFSLALLDFQLGDGTALDLFDSLRDVPIVIATGAGGEEVAIDVLKKGAYDYLIKDAARNYLQILPTTIENVLKRYQAEKDFKESENRYRDLFENSTDLIQSVNLEGRFLYVNKAWYDRLGYSKEDLKALKVTDILTKETQEAYQEFFERVIHEESDAHVDAEFVTKEGKRIPVEGAASCRMVNGQVVSARGIFRDITQRKEFDRMKDAFLSTVSHELRTPLTVIREGVSQMLEGLLGETTEKQKKFLAQVRNNADRLNLIINDLLDISKIEAGKMSLNLEEQDLAAVASETLENFEFLTTKKDIQLRFKASSPVIRACFDRDKIVQVLNNLIGNAIKFTEKGIIEVAISEKTDQIQCAVRDSGRGIDKTDLVKVFDKFQQFGRHDGAGQKGTGLGLAICKGIAELHEGSIDVQSELGQGTTFTFSIPKRHLKEETVS